MIPKALAFAGMLTLVAASVLWPVSPVLAQGRAGGTRGGPVGGFHPGGPIGGIHPGVPLNVSVPHYGPANLYAYRPNSGYIPFVGYYLPNATPRLPTSAYTADYLGQSENAIPNEMVEPAPSGSYIFRTPEGTASKTGNPPAGLNLDTVIEPDTVAHITVRLPKDAELWFGGSKVPTTGSVREFQSPPLKPDRLYTYEVRASWTAGGHPVTQTQQVVVSAGANVHVDFASSFATEGQEKPAK